MLIFTTEIVQDMRSDVTNIIRGSVSNRTKQAVGIMTYLNQSFRFFHGLNIDWVNLASRRGSNDVLQMISSFVESSWDSPRTYHEVTLQYIQKITKAIERKASQLLSAFA